MSVQSEITRLQNAKAAIKAAIEGKGVTVPDATLLDGMASLIESIEAGGGGDFLYGTITPTTTTRYIDVPYASSYNMAAFVEVGMDITSVGAKCCISDYSKNLKNRLMYYGTKLTYTTADSSTVFISSSSSITTIRFRSPLTDNNSWFQAGKTYMYLVFKA